MHGILHAILPLKWNVALTKLKLPLHCYDESGRIVPSVWFNLVFFWGARAPLIVLASFMMGEQGRQLSLSIFPMGNYLVPHLVLGFGYIAIWLLLGRREWLWQRGVSITWLQPLLMLHLMCDVSLQIVTIIAASAHFSAVKGVTLVISLFALGYILRSKRTRLMFVDWRA